MTTFDRPPGSTEDPSHVATTTPRRHVRHFSVRLDYNIYDTGDGEQHELTRSYEEPVSSIDETMAARCWWAALCDEGPNVT